MEYTGHPQAERVLVVMGSAAQTVAQTVAHLCAQGERVGVAQVRLYRPFPAAALLDALPGVRGSDRGAGPDQGARARSASRCSST